MDDRTRKQDGLFEASFDGVEREGFRVAVIGGGPGGMFTAWHLAAKAGPSCRITVFEASDRLGGKILTGEFAGVGPYEAGVAEIYDYSRLGPDPLHDLIVKDLGLQPKYLHGGPCVLDGKIILDPDGLAETFGERTRDEVTSFRQRVADLLSPEAFYFSIPKQDNAHPWAAVSGAALLEREIKDDAARRYIRTMAHSDVAAAPHQTNGLNFLKNVLMDVDGYMDVFSVVGGNEQIVTRLEEELDAEIRLNSNVTAVEPMAGGGYRLELLVNGVAETTTADYVVVALPLASLSTIHWRSEGLEIAMDKHIGYFDRPGHYLRASFLFQRPFWRDELEADWWMLDAFDGCCVYDESARNGYSGYGVLAFLIAGNAALALANVSDQRIEQMCLDALPPQLAHGKELLLDRRIHRWMASVNAIPGGAPARPRALNHRPAPERLPGFLMVGDYMFDATLNGVLDSADAATDLILSDVLRRRRVQPQRELVGAGAPAVPVHGALNLALEQIEDLMSAPALAGILAATWGLGRGAKLLHVGSGAGHMVAALRALGFDATGIEGNRAACLATPPELMKHNLHGDIACLPFEDGEFEAVIETGLCRAAPNDVEKAIAELRRVTKRGVILGSVTTDLSIDVIERFNLLEDTSLLCSRWDWSEKFYAAGFAHALFNPERLGEAWERAEAAGASAGQWYEDPESLLYCVYEPAPQPSSPRSAEPPAKQRPADDLERGGRERAPSAIAAKQVSREEFAFPLKAAPAPSPIAEVPARAATATRLPVAEQFSERPVRTAGEATRPFDYGRKQPSAKPNNNGTDKALLSAKSTRTLGAARAPASRVAGRTTASRPDRRKFRATALMAMSAGLVGAIVVLMAGAPGLRKDSLVIADAGIRFGADAVAALTKGSNSRTDSPRESSPMQSASGEAVVAPVALRGLASPATGDSGSAQVKADNFELKSVDLGAERVLAGAPEPAAPAHAMASPARFTVGIADGPSSTHTTPVAAAPSQSSDRSLDRATSPPPDGTPVAPVSSAATQGLPATEAPKPATERDPEPAANAQAIASSAQPPLGTADATSSTPATPVAASLSQSPDSDLDRATAPAPDGTPTTPGPARTPIAPASSTADQGLPATEAPKPATEREPEPAASVQATASSPESPVATADAASPTLTTAVAAPSPSQSAGDGPDAASPSPTNGTPIAPASSSADQGLPATEASKPATEREPEPAASVQATASSSQSAARTDDGTSSTLATRVAASSPDLAPAPGPDRTPIASISSAADQRLPATEAPKPAIPKHAIKHAPKPERAARAQAIASLAQSPAGTADGASSTPAVPVALPQPSHSAGRSLDRATSPPPNETPIMPVSSAPDQSLPATNPAKPATPKHAIKRASKPVRAAHAEATASLAQPAGGTADGTPSTLSAAVAAPSSQSPDRSPDPAIAPSPNGTSSVPVSPGPDQSLPTGEAPKPAISKRAIKRERPAHAQATASLAQPAVGTADGTSSTLSTPVAAAPPSQSPDNGLGQATSPRPNSECGVWHDWNGRYTVMCGL